MTHLLIVLVLVPPAIDCETRAPMHVNYLRDVRKTDKWKSESRKEGRQYRVCYQPSYPYGQLEVSSLGKFWNTGLVFPPMQ